MLRVSAEWKPHRGYVMHPRSCLRLGLERDELDGFVERGPGLVEADLARVPVAGDDEEVAATALVTERQDAPEILPEHLIALGERKQVFEQVRGHSMGHQDPDRVRELDFAHSMAKEDYTTLQRFAVKESEQF